jgi:hypothetical protein
MPSPDPHLNVDQVTTTTPQGDDPKMTVTPERSAIVDLVPDDRLILEKGSQTPILITEQEVAFGTAAALALPRTTTHWWTEAIHVVAVAIRRFSLTTHPHQARRSYPPHLDFVEDALMSRETHRL